MSVRPVTRLGLKPRVSGRQVVRSADSGLRVHDVNVRLCTGPGRNNTKTGIRIRYGEQQVPTKAAGNPAFLLAGQWARIEDNVLTKGAGTC